VRPREESLEDRTTLLTLRVKAYYRGSVSELGVSDGDMFKYSEVTQSLGRSTPSDRAEEHPRGTVRCSKCGPAWKLYDIGISSHVSRIV